MLSVEQIADEIVAREGGYVNDPDDPGGATNFGVTIHTMRRLGMDLDGDGQVTPEDVRRLSRDQARAIFVRHYFEAPGIGRLPEALQASVFDMYVNAGANAVRLLQRLLNRMGHSLSVDGIIGPLTAAAAAAAARAAPDYIADARPASRKYARRRDGGKGGWITRAEEFISPKYHLTEAEHRARVAKWG